MSPLDLLELEPLIITNRPPLAAFDEVDDPADNTSSPPEPVSPVPTVTYTEPPLPPAADPDPIYKAPLLPILDVPELRITIPETPPVPAFAV